MPTLLKWTYEGGRDGSEEAKRRGEQRAYAGDKVVDDALGNGILDRVNGTDLMINVGTTEGT